MPSVTFTATSYPIDSFCYSRPTGRDQLHATRDNLLCALSIEEALLLSN